MENWYVFELENFGNWGILWIGQLYKFDNFTKSENIQSLIIFQNGMFKQLDYIQN